MLNTKQKITTLIALAIVSITINDSFSTPVCAYEKRAVVDNKWEAKADANKDGIVQPKEAHKAAIKSNQYKKRAVVDNKWEAKADANRDGIVQPKEAHKASINKNQYKKRAVVDHKWEAKADANKDGIVQPKEARKASINKNQYKKRAVVDHKWEVKADKDGNGFVSAAERRSYNFYVVDSDFDGNITDAERIAFWIKRKSKVNTLIEKKYDANADGWIDGFEAQALLRDRLRLIVTHGKAKVDTALEAQYDVNRDGIIDESEAEDLRNTLVNY